MYESWLKERHQKMELGEGRKVAGMKRHGGDIGGEKGCGGVPVGGKISDISRGDAKR